MQGDYFRRGFAEFVGAFALTFVGAGVVMSGGDLTAVALAHGLVIAVFVSALGHISGGHFNPAVTLAFLATRRMSWVLGVVYWAFQMAGAISAALLLWWIYPSVAVNPTHLGSPALNPLIGSGAGAFVEGVGAFFLVFVVFATAADPRGTFKSIAGLSIGFTIALGALGFGRLTGAAFNPSRAFGPILVNDGWTSHSWIWLVGPCVGAVLAGLAYDRLYLRPPRPVPVGPPETGLEEPRPGQTAAS